MRNPISERQVRASAMVAGVGPACVITSFAVWVLRNAAHDVSILMAAVGAVGRYRGALPRSKVSMMSMRPPQQGQGYERLDDSPVSVSAGVSGFVACGGTTRSSRARPPFSAREPLANRPECLMRCTTLG